MSGGVPRGVPRGSGRMGQLGRHQGLEGAWEQLCSDPGETCGVVAVPEHPSCLPGPEGGFFPGPPSRSRESFLCARFRCWLKSRPAKLERNQLPPRSSPAAYGDGDKTPSEGKCPCPARRAGRRGGSLISAGVTGAVLGLLVLGGSITGAEKGLWDQFPSFTGALSSGCAKF